MAWSVQIWLIKSAITEIYIKCCTFVKSWWSFRNLHCFKSQIKLRTLWTIYDDTGSYQMSIWISVAIWLHSQKHSSAHKKWQSVQMPYFNLSTKHHTQSWMNRQSIKQVSVDVKLISCDTMNDLLYEQKINPHWHDCDEWKSQEAELYAFERVSDRYKRWRSSYNS